MTRVGTTTDCCWGYLPPADGRRQRHQRGAMPSYLSLMILYLPLAGNVGNEGAGGSASPPLAGHLLRLTCRTSPSSKTPRQRRVINVVTWPSSPQKLAGVR